MTAAARARTSVAGPNMLRSCEAPTCEAIRYSESVANAPAMAHTMVETRLGLMPEMRARSGFSAEALTLLPTAVRVRNQPRASATTGTTMTMDSSGPAMSTEPMVWLAPMANGNGAPTTVILGSAASTANESWAMPMVATSTMTRGASNRRRITMSSMTAP